MSLAREPLPIKPDFTVKSIDDDLRFPEVYRQLAASLDLKPESQPVIGITSTIRGEGRTTVALGLASTLACDLDCPVTLVDADFESPALARHFNLQSGSLGLADALRGDAELLKLRVLVGSDLCVITAGQIRDDAASLLHQISVRDPFRDSNRPQGVVVIDLPPVLSQGYAGQAARATDALVLVVRAGVTPVDAVREAISRLADCSLSGVVFNGPRSALPSWWPGRGK